MTASDLNVILLMGQSNMAGRGRLADVEPVTHPDILMFRDGEWLPATEPLHTDKPKIAGVGLGMSVAHELVSDGTLTPIGLVATAVGGTPLDRWMAGGDLYEDAMAIAKSALIDNRLAGILWHQGEHDSCFLDKAESYAQRFTEMVASVRDELNAPDVPVIAGELGPFLEERDGCPHYTIVNQAFHDLKRTLPNYDLATAEELTCNGDLLHFNAASLREFGHRYASRFRRLVQ